MRCNCDCVDEARWEKLDKVKRIIAFCIGGLIILVQLRWTDWVGMRFGFLLSPLFRGFFYFFVGTSVLLPINNKANGIDLGVFSWCVGFSSIMLGLVELFFGGKCTNGDDVTIGARSKKNKNVEVTPPALAGPGGPAVDGDQSSKKQGGFFSRKKKEDKPPSDAFTVSVGGTVGGQPVNVSQQVTPQQASAAAGMAASAAGSSDNPFFGNNHIR